MSDKELNQVEQEELNAEVEGQMDEAKASFGVDAEVPEPTTKENTPPGDAPKDEDKKKNPEQGSSVKPTKVKAINNIAQAVKGMKNEEFERVYEAIMAAVEGREVVAEEKEEAETTAIAVRELRQISAGDVNVAEDVAAMFNGEDLSEEFTTKATTIFEAAVVAKVNELLETVTVDLEAEVEANKDAMMEELSAKLDSYLEYVAEEWMQENELAVEQGIRAEIAENFMVGLRNLFTESYIDIPEEKVDLVDEMASKIEELETSINEQMEKNIDLKAELAEAVKASVLRSITEGLTESQAVKLSSLAEGVEFEDEASYAERLETIKENYFGAAEETLNEETDFDNEPLEDESDAVSVDPGMAAYMSAITKSIKK
jgi:hypothetical protein